MTASLVRQVDSVKRLLNTEAKPFVSAELRDLFDQRPGTWLAQPPHLERMFAALCAASWPLLAAFPVVGPDKMLCRDMLPTIAWWVDLQPKNGYEHSDDTWIKSRASEYRQKGAPLPAYRQLSLHCRNRMYMYPPPQGVLAGPAGTCALTRIARALVLEEIAMEDRIRR